MFFIGSFPIYAGPTVLVWLAVQLGEAVEQHHRDLEAPRVNLESLFIIGERNVVCEPTGRLDTLEGVRGAGRMGGFTWRWTWRALMRTLCRSPRSPQRLMNLVCAERSLGLCIASLAVVGRW